MTFSVEKDPNADLDYAIDWSAWLGTDTITTSSWTLSDGKMSQHDGSIDATGKITTVWLTGGTLSNALSIGTPIALVTNAITTVAGRADERSIKITVVDR